MQRQDGEGPRVHEGRDKVPGESRGGGLQGPMESYVRHYNEIRPHCALGYRTPKEVFEKTSALGIQIPDIARMIDEAFMASRS